MTKPVLIAFSHQRWGFVFQRSQHLFSRLADRWRVVFVEEPLQQAGPARLVRHEAIPGVEVLVPHTPLHAPGFHDEQLGLMQALLATYLRSEALRCDVAWLTTPMALPLLRTADPRCVVYDCLPDGAMTSGASQRLRQRESALLLRASLVLTGGPSLYEARRSQHPNVHCVPSSVDAGPFDPRWLELSGIEAKAVDALQGSLPRPRLGYFGVIDERLDFGLIEALARRHTGWQVVMAGPVVGIDPASLPCQPNLHWLGIQPYERLPYLLAGWDVALMPFATTEPNRHINPTKTLQYMAGGKPVVSTAVPDVMSMYGYVVDVAHTHEQFLRACEAVLDEQAPVRLHRVARMLAAVSTHSWERVAEQVNGLLTKALAGSRPLVFVELDGPRVTA